MIWKPDSCPKYHQGDHCAFEITHDQNGEQVLVSVLNKCKFHSKHPNASVHGTVLAENKKRFSVINEMVKRNASLTKKNSEGETVIDFDKFTIEIDNTDTFTVEAGGKVVKFKKDDDAVEAVNKGKNKNV
jgi:hypothetical protein